ncbi:MAG: tetraacyldisaccharide 4'-kinase [Deltaproteobacteria bacterium]|nr:tetraacyldisaccharide 4'-kinase [Deltaproteobacteria bacterium]
MDWPRIFNTKGFTPLIPALAPLAFLYGVAVRLRIMGRKTIFKSKSLPGSVISIGNLCVGGTGKTPATCMLAEWALREGYRVVVLSRGYAGKHQKKILEVSNGKEIHAGPVEAGDEPYLIAKRLPGVPVIVSKKRYLAGLHALHRFRANLFILDDGFQHLTLKRNLDMVLIDAADPFGNGRLLPWGPLREPLAQLERANVVIMTRSSHSPSKDDLSLILKKRFPGIAFFKADHIPERIVFPGQGRHHDLDFLKGKRIMAFAGIARPELFQKTLIQLGAEIKGFKKFKDHFMFNKDIFRKMVIEKDRMGADYMITTEKDWVKLEQVAEGYPYLAYLTIRFDILDEKDRFLQLIKRTIEGK